jgi:hypothetical protein
MRAIFISYRREDAEGQAGRLFDDLVRHFGEGSVFMDVAGIAAGRDFRRVIDEHVASCGVLLALIGKSWIDAKDESGQRRLDNAGDFVRLETASALKRDIPVIPVLVHGALMPRAEQLPPDLAELAYRNGVELTHARWDSDVRVLIKELSPHVEFGQKVVPSARWSSRMVVAGAAALIAVVLGGFAWYRGSDTVGPVGLPPETRGQTPASQPDNPSTTSLSATGTASDLCKELDGKSIEFIGNNYRGVIGPAGIKLEESELGTFRFETEVVFTDRKVIQQFGKALRDPMNGVCRNNNVITLDRTLGDGTVHHHTGSLTMGRTGRLEMNGDFQDRTDSYKWSGWTADPTTK